MARTPLGLNKGSWTRDEDLRLRNYIEAHGEGEWRTLPEKAGLLRCGKSCRLRWMSYLRPDVKRGRILPDEEDLILRLHRLLGNRWSLIAGRIPGRTDNEIKNYWNNHLSKKLLGQGIDPRTHKHLSESQGKGLNAADRKTNKKSQRENTTTVPARNIDQRRADLQVVPSKGRRAIPAHGNEDDEASATWLAHNQLPQTSLTCNPQYASVANNFSSQTSVISSMPYVFQEYTNSTCFPGISSSSTTTNNMGSKQIYFPPLTPSTCFNSSEQLAGVGCYDLDQDLMKNPVTSSNAMKTATVRLSSGLVTAPAPFATQFESSHAFLSGNALLDEKRQMFLQSLQDLEMNPCYSFTVHPSEETIYNKLSHTSCVVPDQIAVACSYSYPVIPTAMGTALGDFNSDIFPSLLGSFGNEELPLQEPNTDTSIAHNVQLCASSQPKAENLTGYDLWSILSPSSHYHPNG